MNARRSPWHCPPTLHSTCSVPRVKEDPVLVGCFLGYFLRLWHTIRIDRPFFVFRKSPPSPANPRISSPISRAFNALRNRSGSDFAAKKPVCQASVRPRRGLGERNKMFSKSHRKLPRLTRLTPVQALDCARRVVISVWNRPRRMCFSLVCGERADWQGVCRRYSG